jgi:hypothetical protein
MVSDVIQSGPQALGVKQAKFKSCMSSQQFLVESSSHDLREVGKEKAVPPLNAAGLQVPRYP